MEQTINPDIFLEIPQEIWRTIVTDNHLSYQSISVLKLVRYNWNAIIQHSFISVEAVEKEKSYVCTNRLMFIAQEYAKHHTNAIRKEFYHIFNNNNKDKRLQAQSLLWGLRIEDSIPTTISMHYRTVLNDFTTLEKKEKLFKDAWEKDETIELILLSGLKDDFALFCWKEYFWSELPACLKYSVENVKKILIYPEIAQFINVKPKGLKEFLQKQGKSYYYKEGFIPITYAMESRGVLPELLNCQYVNVNAQCDEGNTLLHKILESSNPLFLLCKHDQSADWFIKNNEGKAPFDIFCDKGGMQFLNILSQVFIDAKEQQIISEEDISRASELSLQAQLIQLRLLDQKEKELSQKEKELDKKSKILSTRNMGLLHKRLLVL